MKASCILPLILLLAGCAESPAAYPPGDSTFKNPVALEWQSYHDDFTLFIDKEVPGAPSGSALGTRDNCIMLHFGEFGRDPYEIRSGRAILTWKPDDPLSETLHLVIFQGDEGRQDEWAGTSPLTAPFSSEGKKMKWAYVFSVETGIEEIPRQQEVRLELHFAYLAEHEISIGVANCNMMF